MSTQDRKAKARAAAPKAGAGANAIVIGGIVMVLAIVIVVAAVSINAVRTSGGASELPQGVEQGEPIEPYADAKPAKDAPVVDVYEDFRCPACKQFEASSGQTITELAEDGTIRLRVHLMTLIDNNTGGESSAVAGSSAICAADQGKWTEFHEALFALQPPTETADGFPESAYPQAAEAAGLSGDALDEWQQCTDDTTYVDYVQGVDDASVKAGIKGTPTVKVEGTTLDLGAATGTKLEKVLTSGEVPKDMVMQQ
ncbi:DsbA family protein [Janibacter sp. GS2]|uniref:DsbA family protein n=1 Tax=Janibacter sp. GS2 TaxID=3442646 RepID=UPI003EB87F31